MQARRVTSRSQAHGPRRAGARRAFTLMELTVVMSLMLLLAAATIPSAVNLFAAAADTQSYNLLNAQLKSARAHAIGKGTYAGAHVQMGKVGDQIGTCYTLVMQYDWAQNFFTPAEGFMPHRVPGTMAFGEVTGDFITAATFGEMDDASLADFTTFTIVFTGGGSVCRYVRGENVKYDAAGKVFAGPGNAKLWDLPEEELGVTALMLVDYTKLQQRTSIERGAYLNETSEFLPVSIHTGQLFERQ